MLRTRPTMNSLVANVLNRVLGTWVKGLDPESLQMSIYRGEVQLGPIELRPETISGLGLPVTLVSATVQKITVTIPWTSLLFSPWTIEVLGVEVEVESTSEVDAMNKKREVGLFYEAKQRVLEQFELLPEEDVATEPGFAMKMVGRILDNLQLSIREFRIKVSHPLANTTFAFSFGRVAILTCNSSWNPEYISGADVINKVASVDNLSVTFSCAELGEVSIIEPLSFLLKAEINRGRADFPKLKADLILGEEKKLVRINLRPEFVVGLKELNIFFAHYREFRAGVLSQIQLHDLESTEVDIYRALYVGWKQTPEQFAESLTAFERDKTNASLIAQRKVARNKQSLVLSIKQKEEEIKAIQTPSSGRFGRISWLIPFGGDTEAGKAAKIQALQDEILILKSKHDSQAKEIETFIGEKDKSTEGNGGKAISFTMESFQLVFFDHCTEALVLNMSGIKANFSNSSSSMSILVGHREISLRQNINPESVFPLVVLCTTLRSTYNYDNGLHKVVLTAKESYFVYDVKMIQYFVGILNAVTPKNIDLEGYSRQISEKTLKYVRLGRRESVSLPATSGPPARFSVMIIAQAPHFYLPLSSTGQCLYLDLGNVKVKTKSQTEDDASLFDEFEVEMEKTCLELWAQALSPKEAVEGGRETILSPFSISSKVRKALSQDSLVSFASETTVQPIEIRLSDTFLRFGFELLAEAKAIWASLTPAKSIETAVQTTAYEMGQNIQVAMRNRNSASPSHLRVDLERIKITLVKDNCPFRCLSFVQTHAAMTIDRLANMQLTFVLGAVTASDPSVAHWQTLLEPLRTEDEPQPAFLCFENVLQEELRSMHEIEHGPAMLEVRYSFEATMNSTVIYVKTGALMFLPHAESYRNLKMFLNSCMGTRVSHTAKTTVSAETTPQLPPEATEDQKQLEFSRRTQQHSIFAVKLEVGMIKLYVLEAPDIPSTRALVVELEAGVSYKTEQSTTVYYDEKGLVASQEVSGRKDEVVFKIFGLHSYFLSAGQLESSLEGAQIATEEIRDLLRPMRATFIYACEFQTDVDDIMLEVNIELVEASISYRDIRSLQAILQSFQSVMTPPTAKVAYVPVKKRLTKYDIDIRWETAIIGLVDDFRKNSTPVLKAISSNFTFEMALFQSFFLLRAGAAMEVRYFNAAVMEWELLLEEVVWRTFALEPKDFTQSKNFEPPKPITIFDFSILGVAKVNLSLAMLASVGDILRSIQRLMASKSGKYRTLQDTERDAEKVPQQRYVFHNQLGRKVKISLRNEDGEPVEWMLEAEERKEVTKSEIEKELKLTTSTTQRRFGGHYYELELPTTMTIEIDGEVVIENIRIDDTERHHFTVSNSLNYTFGGLVNKHSKGQQQVIALQSLLRVVNRTEMQLYIRASDKELPRPIDPDSSIAAPLTWTEPAQSLSLSVEKEKWVEVSLCGNMELAEGVNVVIDEVDLEVKNTLEVLQVLIVSTPLSLVNSLPCTITGYYLDDRDPTHAVERVVTCEPGRTMKLAQIPFTAEAHKWRWVLDLDNSQTPLVPLRDGEQSYKLSGNISADKFTLACERNTFTSCLDFDYQEETQVRAYYNSKVATVYAPYILINNTRHKLDFKAERTFLQVAPLASGLAVVEKPLFKVRLTGDEYGTTSSYCQKFNGSTVGLAGCLQSVHKTKVFEETPDSMRFGVTIEQAPWPLSLSKVIRIYPRFFVFNLSSADLFLQQEGTSQLFPIPHGTREPFHFPSDSNILLRLSEDKSTWSSCFSMENIDNFQVIVRATKPISAQEEENEFASEFNLNPLSLKPTRPKLTRFLDVFVSTANEAVIFLIIKDPQYPSILIQNQTEDMIEVWQLDGQERMSVLPMNNLPIVLENLMENDPMIVLSTAGDLRTFSLSKEKLFTHKLAEYEVSLHVKKVTKVLRITRPAQSKANKFAKKLLHNLILSRSSNESESVVYDHFIFCRFTCKIEGLEISLIDGAPAEIFVVTVGKINIQAKRKENCAQYKDVTLTVKAEIASLQIDNMSGGKEEFPVLLAQRIQSMPLLGLEIKSKSTSKVQEDGRESAISYQVKRLNLHLQEMLLQIHQDTLVHFLEVLGQIQSHFRFKSEARSDDAYIRSVRESVSEITKTEMPGLELGDELTTKVFFEVVNLGSIKLTISYRTVSKKRNFILTNQSSEVTKFVEKIASAIVNISNSSLYFSSILLHKSFKSTQELIRGVIRNYVRQGALQFYRLLGASELIGNPLGLISKLGTGVFEFFDEPRKGLKTPKDFAKGVGRGVRSLVSSVVSGSMESVSQVTGSLYRIVSQDQTASRTGAFAREFKGSIVGLVQGISGLVTKPIEGAKEGFAGAVRGVGSGIYGAVTAPVAMVLRVSSSATSSIADVTTFSNAFECTRKRFPRYFDPKKRLVPYNRALAEVREYWKRHSLQNEKELFCIEFSSKVAVLITNSRVVVLESGKMLGAMDLVDIVNLRVLKLIEDRAIQRFLFQVISSHRVLPIISTRFSVVGQLYEVLTSLIHPILRMNVGISQEYNILTA